MGGDQSKSRTCGGEQKVEQKPKPDGFYLLLLHDPTIGKQMHLDIVGKDDTNIVATMVAKVPTPCCSYIYKEQKGGKVNYVGYVLSDYVTRPDRDEKVYTIVSIGVEPEYRRQGIASTLLKEAIKGDPETYIYVRSGNVPMVKFCEKMGFKLFKNFPGYCKTENGSEDLYYLRHTH